MHWSYWIATKSTNKTQVGYKSSKKKKFSRTSITVAFFKVRHQLLWGERMDGSIALHCFWWEEHSDVMGLFLCATTQTYIAIPFHDCLLYFVLYFPIFGKYNTKESRQVQVMHAWCWCLIPLLVSDDGISLPSPPQPHVRCQPQPTKAKLY